MALLHLVDSFADRPFSGNPAAVCLLEAERPADWMQSLAFELGYSETAFVLRRDTTMTLRWFAPGAEVALCGHATLAAAHVLWNVGRAQGSIAFETRSGTLVCERTPRGISIDLPRSDLQDEPPPVGLMAALGGARPLTIKRTQQDAVLVELEDEEAVRRLTPDLAALAQVKARGMCVTARSASTEFDFVSRYFAPAIGIPEDPVTGSAHCALTPFWSARLEKTELRARQLSRRGGSLDVALVGDRVRLVGRAITVFTGALTV